MSLVNLEKEILEKEGLEGSALFLSQGQKRRLNIARALSLEREVIILDEPFANLDEGNIQKIKNNLQRLGEKILIIVSHNVDEGDVFFWRNNLLVKIKLIKEKRY